MNIAKAAKTVALVIASPAIFVGGVAWGLVVIGNCYLNRKNK